MIRLQFGMDALNSLIVGPAPSALISGTLICLGPEWRIVAAYRDHAWRVGDSLFSCFEFMERELTIIGFDGPPGGPIRLHRRSGRVTVSDGALYADGMLVA